VVNICGKFCIKIFLHYIDIAIFPLRYFILPIVQKKSIKTRNNNLHKSYFTLPLQLLHQFNILLFMYNYVYHRNKLPVVFST